VSPQGELVEVIRYWLGKANESLAAAEDEMDVTVWQGQTSGMEMKDMVINQRFSSRIL